MKVRFLSYKPLVSFAFLFLIACTPQEQPYEESPSHKSELKESLFITPDGAALPYRHWQPKGTFKAVVIALHGFNDYSRAFTGLGEYLSVRGVAVYAYDQRGFGNAPMTGIWGGQKNFTADLAAWIKFLKQSHPDLPIYVLGESMGAAVVVSAITSEGFIQPDGVILVSPAMWGGDAMSPFYRILSAISAHIMPGYKLTGSDLNIRPTDNIKMLQQMGMDPLIIKATRLDAVYGLVNLMGDAHEHMAQVKTPVLLVYGGKDEVIPEQIIKDSMQFLGDDSNCIYYPDGYHMLLRDLNAKIVMKDIASWLWTSKKKQPLSQCNK